MYQPKIRDDLIRRLYRLGKTLDVPMTKLASVLMELGIHQLEEALERKGCKVLDEIPLSGRRKK